MFLITICFKRVEGKGTPGFELSKTSIDFSKSTWGYKFLILFWKLRYTCCIAYI